MVMFGYRMKTARMFDANDFRDVVCCTACFCAHGVHGVHEKSVNMKNIAENVYWKQFGDTQVCSRVNKNVINTLINNCCRGIKLNDVIR